MRKWVIRAAVVGLFAGVAGAQDRPTVLPPPKPADEPRKLRSELEQLVADREATAKELADAPGLLSERVKLRTQLLDLVKKIGEKKPAPPAVMPPPSAPVKAVEGPMPPAVKPRILFEPDVRPLNALRAAMNAYRAGEIDTALLAFSQIQPESYGKDDATFIRYMTACYLRKEGKRTEALAIYREIANEKDNSYLADRAISQIETINIVQGLQTELEQLRSRRKSK